MARTVNRNQTIEEFRNTYNSLAGDVGSLTGLTGTISNSNSLVDAINEVENKTFFFQTFEYVATAGQTVFTGTDRNSNTLLMRSGRFQVFHNKALSSEHLVEGDDYSIAAPDGQGNFQSISLNVAASVGDVITIYTFTGSSLGTTSSAGGGGTGQFTETAANTIYNINNNGVILNGDSTSRTTTLQSGFTIQLAGATYGEENLTLASGKTLSAPTITDGTATITGGVGTGFSSITSTALVGALTGNVTGDITGDVKHGGSVVLDASTGALTGQVSDITNHQITDLSDVDTTAPSNGQILVYNSSSSKYVPTDQNTTDTVTEGSSNLYFTNERVDDRVNALLQAGTGISLSYDDPNNTLTITGVAQFTTSDARSAISGGDGLAYNSSTGVMSVNTSNGIEINSDNVELDYEIVSTAPTGVGSTATGHLWFVV